jgi:hypothetical protein
VDDEGVWPIVSRCVGLVHRNILNIRAKTAPTHCGFDHLLDACDSLAAERRFE